MSRYTSKRKGEYPVDYEGVLEISPYWAKAVAIAEARRMKKLYLSDILIISSVLIAAGYWVLGRYSG